MKRFSTVIACGLVAVGVMAASASMERARRHAIAIDRPRSGIF
ncbi:MAG: hypothetical protein OSJ46_05625 [Duncaniella sp.]|nr:hypothetical protein [Duncaniella sp.]